ncbi:MAG: hypothetical protein KF760_08925 [Candidatus Eremiobacteraeota bacterium]|nr:hypothetical protein [Candidatus Eremiobacteraeota bacterium]MCW5869060.1 hypothetical protein [Candidatus Eremiobacteraeota bacterium]
MSSKVMNLGKFDAVGQWSALPLRPKVEPKASDNAEGLTNLPVDSVGIEGLGKDVDGAFKAKNGGDLIGRTFRGIPHTICYGPLRRSPEYNPEVKTEGHTRVGALPRLLRSLGESGVDIVG